MYRLRRAAQAGFADWASRIRSGPLQQRLPAGFVSAGGKLVANPDEWQPEQALVGEEARGELRVIHPEVAEASLGPGPAGRVHECCGAQPLGESPKLPGRDRLPSEVDELESEAPLLEESEGSPGLLGIFPAEDLDERRCWRRGRAQANLGDGIGRSVAVRYHRGHRRCPVTVWFTVQLDDRPGSLARVATALGERGVNITGIVGVAEDTDGALMLTTSDADATRAAFEGLGLAFEEHDASGGLDPHRMSVSDLRGR